MEKGETKSLNKKGTWGGVQIETYPIENGRRTVGTENQWGTRRAGGYEAGNRSLGGGPTPPRNAYGQKIGRRTVGDLWKGLR